jgi:hypothetical protein
MISGTRGLEQLELQPAAQTRLVDIGQQRFHLRAVRQLLQHRTERLFDVGQLFAVGLQVDGLALLIQERGAQRVFFGARRSELVPLR